MTNINNIISDINHMYASREYTQLDIANTLNQTYNIHLNTSDIRSITSQFGYKHTINRTPDKKTVVVFINNTMKRHLIH